jgi:phage gp29-like protein
VTKSQRRSIKQRKNGSHASKGAVVSTPLSSIIRPARYSAWRSLPRLAAITPQYLEAILWGALGGFQVQQWELFDLMADTWPELTACMQELTYGVERKKMIFEPFHEEDEKPTPDAIDKQHFVSQALRCMEPNPAGDENDLRGTVKDLVDAWFRGTTVLEIFWQSVEGVGICPRATQWVHPNNFAFGADNIMGLRGDKDGNYYTDPVQPLPARIVAFPPNKFLIGLHKAKSGPPLGCALLRPLAWWWCAANFSSDWLLNLGQLFGIPWRIAYTDPHSPPEVLNAIDQMLQNMGSSTWARFPVGTTIDTISPSKEGSDHSPQGELLDRADRYARSLILGQTMTGSHGTTGKGGGQAFGAVEHSVKEDRIDAAGQFVAKVLNNQLIKSILLLNYGNTEEAPTVRFLEDEEGDLATAQRDKVLVDVGLPIGVDFMRKKYGIPEPADDEELLKPSAKIGAPGENSGQTQPGVNADREALGDQTNDTETKVDETVEARLQKLSAITDDALFTKSLGELANELSRHES